MKVNSANFTTSFLASRIDNSGVCVIPLEINSNLNIQQFKIKNLVVCENYKYRDNSFYKSFLSVNDMRKTYLEYAESNAQMELDKILV